MIYEHAMRVIVFVACCDSRASERGERSLGGYGGGGERLPASPSSDATPSTTPLHAHPQGDGARGQPRFGKNKNLSIESIFRLFFN